MKCWAFLLDRSSSILADFLTRDSPGSLPTENVDLLSRMLLVTFLDPIHNIELRLRR